jgi:UDP-N-acetyl-D-glucosamine dehydrogenase
MDAVVAGQGHVGLPLSVRAAEAGHSVVGYDVDERRVKRLAAGDSHVEDVPAERLQPLLESGSYRPTADERDVAGFELAAIAVPTPLRNGVPDLSHVAASARMLSRYLRPGAAVVLESTTYPGTTQELVGPLLEEGSGLVAGNDFHLGYSPERIDPGNPSWRLENTPKVVSGVNAASLEAVQAFYASLVETTVAVSSCEQAEFTKLLENTFRHVNIALVNELAIFAHDLGLDVWEAIDAAATKPFGYLRFTPGPGVGGQCLPIDPSYLSWRVRCALNQELRFVGLANDINGSMPEYVVRRLVQTLRARRRSVNGSRILLLGLAYKRNVGDARGSPSVRVAQLLQRMGAEVRAADPHVIDEAHARTNLYGPMLQVKATPEQLSAADAVVLLTDHDDFDYQAVMQHSRYVLDCRHRLSGPNVEVL